MHEMSIHASYPPETSGAGEVHESGYIVAIRSWRLRLVETVHPSNLGVYRSPEYGLACEAAAILAYDTVERHIGTSTHLTVSHDTNGLPSWTGRNDFHTCFVVHVLERGIDGDTGDGIDEMIEGLGGMGFVEQRPFWERR